MIPLLLPARPLLSVLIHRMGFDESQIKLDSRRRRAGSSSLTPEGASVSCAARSNGSERVTLLSEALVYSPGSDEPPAALKVWDLQTASVL